MLATRCRITRKDTVHAYDDPRYEPSYPPYTDTREHLPDSEPDHTLEFNVDDFRIHVTAKRVKHEHWIEFVRALTRLLTESRRP